MANYFKPFWGTKPRIKEVWYCDGNNSHFPWDILEIGVTADGKIVDIKIPGVMPFFVFRVHDHLRIGTSTARVTDGQKWGWPVDYGDGGARELLDFDDPAAPQHGALNYSIQDQALLVSYLQRWWAGEGR